MRQGAGHATLRRAKYRASAGHSAPHRLYNLDDHHQRQNRRGNSPMKFVAVAAAILRARADITLFFAVTGAFLLRGDMSWALE